MMHYPDFEKAINDIKERFRYSKTIHTKKWQGVEIQTKPEMAMHELLDISLKVPMDTEELDVYRDQVKPNLPWADAHFYERVCGRPINPGREWENWPYNKSADTFRDNQKQFNHNYMERYWPKFGSYPHTLDAKDFDQKYSPEAPGDYQVGLRERYGDLNDVIDLLQREPDTRQAFFPVWFPEDTGVVHGGRVPCTIGYHFIMRNNHLHIIYYIRSCDFIRHFRDDIYLTVRLLLWVLEELRKKDDGWKDVKPGFFSMYITNLHIFRNDYNTLF